MRTELLMELRYELYKDASLLEETGKEEDFVQRLKKEGISEEEAMMAVDFANTLDEGEFTSYVIKKSEDDYIKNLKKMIGYAKMAEGYQEMGELNLQISEEFSFLENEGDKMNEMGSTKTESKAE